VETAECCIPRKMRISVGKPKWVFSKYGADNISGITAYLSTVVR
jgi:hypothetical protein